MPSRPFHHGNLRAVLLEQAEVLLREGGVDALSLRELARQAGVSHGAPRSHFVDRQALLDALAERGFDRLVADIRAAAADSASFAAAFRQVGHAYVDFAVRDAALMELMFAAKLDDPPDAVRRAAERLFATLDDLMRRSYPEGEPAPESADRLKMLFAATMQGTATLSAARRISAGQAAALVDDATDLILRSVRTDDAGGGRPERGGR